MSSFEAATVQALRRDVAHQIARHARHLGSSQRVRAVRLGIPQPTLSKIVNGRVSDLSIELLLRIAIRARLPLTLQTGSMAQEAGAFLAVTCRRGAHERSPSSEVSRASSAESQLRLTPTQRLDAFLEHSQLMHELHASGRRVVERKRRLPAKVPRR